MAERLHKKIEFNNNSLIKNFKLVIFFAAPLFFIIQGCDLFSTRNAEMPTQPRSDFEPAATVDILIQNLINSLKDKDVGNYLTCLSDTSFTDKKFYFSPSSEASSTYPTLSENWNRRNEEQYFTNMTIKSSSSSQIVLNLTESSRNNFGDSTFYTAAYSLTVPFVNTNSEITPEIYQGTLTFKMVRDSRSVWSIYFWQDNKNSTANKTWSDLKGSLAN
jgi:hypothetical protein